MVAILAVDQGTTSTKAFRCENGGPPILLGRRIHRQIHPRPGWVEHDPVEIADHVLDLVQVGEPCDAIALANQGETVVAWDAVTKRPLYNAIVWQDERTRNDLERLRADGVEALTLERAGLPLDPYFSASKLRWLLDHAEGARDLARSGRLRLGTSDAFLLDRLTGSYCTDVSTASRTSLLDLNSLQWDLDLCEAFGVPMDLLPPILPTTGLFGEVIGLGSPVLVSIVDQQAALYGHGCREPGDVKITFGTGAFALGLTAQGPASAAHSGLIPTCAWQIGSDRPRFALDGGVLTAGAALEWLRSIGLITDFVELDDFNGPPVAERGVFFVPAQAGLGCPHWDRSARGLWIGMDLATSRADLCRAVIEGISFRTADLVAAFEALTPCMRIAIDGGLTRSTYFCQFLADALGKVIHVAKTADVSAMGLLQLAARGAMPGAPAPMPTYQRIEPKHVLSCQVRDRFSDAMQRSRGWSDG